MVTEQQAIAAAQSLVKVFNNNPQTPPQSHAVWVKCTVDPVNSEFIRRICVSEHPKWKGKLNIPESHLNIPVDKVDWPKGQ